MPKHSIVQVFLDEVSIIRRSPEAEQERAVAIYDFLESNHFIFKQFSNSQFSMSFDLYYKGKESNE